MHCLFALALALVPVGFQPAQDPDVDDGSGGIEELRASDREIAVEDLTSDRQIRDRLASILGTTRRFDSLQLEVDAGVVFLTGTVQDERDRTWVVDLARATEGVAAVLNRIEVIDGPVWDLQPARNELMGMWKNAIRRLPQFAIGLLTFLLTVLIAGGAARTMARLTTRKVQSELLKMVVEKLLLVLVIVLGLYVFLRISGLTQVAVTVMGGTGVVGLILGFAFRDIAENFLSSILISIQRPFQYGDTIEVEGYRGVVQRVTPRGTILLDFEGNFIQLANAKVYKSTIKNFTANPKVRADFVIGVGYDASITDAQTIVLETLSGQGAVLDDPKPMVLVDELGSSTVNLRVYFWVDGVEHSHLKVRSALMRRCVRALEDAKVSMPDDAREVIFPGGVPVTMLEANSEDPRGSRATEEPDNDPRGSVHSAEDHEESNEAEGGLSSETTELEDQARAARSPEEGADVLEVTQGAT